MTACAMQRAFVIRSLIGIMSVIKDQITALQRHNA